MCIVLVSTSHPGYALIIIDNRDEFILRPTSRPHWWNHANGASVLSSRDLQRPEKGTWLGITREGVFAVLTNYRETAPNDPITPIHGTRSRGGIVTAWLGCDSREATEESVHHLVKDGGVTGVGGFSMICGKLRRKSNGELEPIAVVSNRSDHIDRVPWIAASRGEVHGLSNTSFEDPDSWPKLENGKRMFEETIREAVKDNVSEEQLIEKLFAVLDTDTLPRHSDMSLSEYVFELKHSIFVPPIGDALHREAMQKATANGTGGWATDDQRAAEELKAEERPDENTVGFETGMYGTQRQTVILVGWDGEVTYHERALWDGNGNAIPRGEADEVIRFRIDGWNDGCTSSR